METIIENEYNFLKLLTRNGAPFDYEKQLFDNHYKRIIEILNDNNPPPYEIEIQPTSACNLKCEHCFGSILTSELLPNKMDKKAMEKIAERINEFEINNHEIETVKFCGTTGDPLVNPATVHSIKLFKNIGKKVIIYTNGLWLDKISENGKKYLDYLLEADKVNISLDAGTKETFLKIKKVDGFEKTIKSIKELVEKRNKTKSNLRIDLSYVIGLQNYSEIVKITKIANKIGVDNIIFRVDFAKPETIQPIIKKIHEQKIIATKIKNKKTKIWFAYSNEDLESIEKKEENAFYSRGKKCFNHHFWACIGSDCNLYVCGHRTYKGVENFGNVLDTPLEKIWLSKKRLEIVNNLPNEQCKFCSPSCHRRDCFMKHISNLGTKNIEKLHDKYYKQNIKQICEIK
jgi:MoaA/NifB/PqqE/SkfB family radical SAM enzyme